MRSRMYARGIAIVMLAVLATWFLYHGDQTRNGQVADPTDWRRTHFGEYSVDRLYGNSGQDTPIESGQGAPARSLLQTYAVVRTVTRTGAPIQRAEVALQGVDTADLVIVEVTDRAGVARLSLDGIAQASNLIASADGYRSESLSVDDVRASLESVAGLTIMLRRMLSIQGTVRWEDGHPAPGVTVLAWPGTRPISKPDLAKVLADRSDSSGSGEVLVGTTDTGGAYSLQGARPGVRYLVTGGAPGLLTPIVATTCRAPGPAQVDLPARAHFAVLLQSIDEGGAPLDRPHVTFGSEYITRFPKGVVAMPPSNRVQRALVGIDRIDWEPEDSGVLLQYVGREDSQAPGPVRHRALHPGFEPLDIELRIPRTTHGLQIKSLLLTRSDDLLGRIFVNVIGWVGDDSTLGSVRPAATLVLVDIESGQTTECYVRKSSQSVIIVEGVPHGTYRSWLTMKFDLEHLHPLGEEQVTVNDSDATLIFDLRDTSRLEIELGDDVARLVGQRAMFNVGSEETGLAGWFAFEHQPYVVESIRPGRYTVTLYALDEPGGSRVRVEEVDVLPGEAALVRLTNASSHEAPFPIPGMER